MINVFRDIAVAGSKKQPQMVDQTFEEAPILEMIPMQAASHGLFNVAEEVADADAASLVDLDDELPVLSSRSKLRQFDLSILGGKMYVGEDTARRYGGASAYFASRQSAILRKTGMVTEKSILYNNLRAFAEANHTAADPKLISAGASGGYSIIAVKWVPGEVTGLYDPGFAGKGMMFDIAALGGGQLVEFKRTANGVEKTLTGFGVRLKSYFGIQLANKRYVGAVVNCTKSGANLPTETMIDEIISAVRGAPGNTFLYMHPDMKVGLQKYKASSMQTTVETQSLKRTFQAWNDIPIVTSYNFLKGTESAVTVAT